MKDSRSSKTSFTTEFAPRPRGSRWCGWGRAAKWRCRTTWAPSRCAMATWCASRGPRAGRQWLQESTLATKRTRWCSRTSCLSSRPCCFKFPEIICNRSCGILMFADLRWILFLCFYDLHLSTYNCLCHRIYLGTQHFKPVALPDN